ncbi:hypothetical protein ACP275_13G058000 [Erythranthe tilingii]
METTEEHISRHHNRSNGEQTVDRLSDLPDSVLTHILSLLPTKSSVRTSILGQRWRYVWAYVPNLVFINDSQDAINRVFLLHKLRNIITFKLAGRFGRNENHQIETWINNAVELNVQKLDINCRLYEVALPRRLCVCKTLVDLRLTDCGVIPKAGPLFLPHLKKLHLICAQYEANESLQHLLSGCPVLEELEIYLYVDYYHCRISSPTIKRLVIDLHFRGEEPDNIDYYHRLEINTPALVYLKFVDYSGQHIKCGALTSLIEADIDICAKGEAKDFLYSQSALEFIDRLHGVKCLTLDLLACTKICDSVFSTWKGKSFRNLTKLELIAASRFLSKILENADNLEILIFSEVFEQIELIEGWTEPEQVPTCLLSHLRTIKLFHFAGKEHIFPIIRYLLRNARVLERMEIVYPSFGDPVEHSYMLDTISLFERGSKACKVAYVSK